MDKYKNNSEDMLVAESLNHFILSESLEEVFAELGMSKDDPEYLEYVKTFPDLDDPDYEKKFAAWIVNDDIDAKKIKFIHNKQTENNIDLEKSIDAFQSFKDYKDFVLSKEQTPEEEAQSHPPIVRQEIKDTNQSIENATDRDVELIISPAEVEKEESKIFTKILKTGYECLTGIYNSPPMTNPGQGLYIWTYKRDLVRKDNRLKFGEYGSKANIPKTPIDTISGYGAGQFGTAVILYAVKFTPELIEKFGTAFKAEMKIQKEIQKNKGFRVGKNRKLEGAGIRSREVFGGIELDKLIEIINEVLYDVPKLKAFDMRDEQKEAHDKMVNYFSGGGKEFLLAAKMRFGKNFTLLNVVKTMDLKNVLVLTYKPHVFPSLKDDLSNHVNFNGWEVVDYKQDRKNILPAEDKPKIFMSSAQLAQYKKSNADDSENYDLEKTSINDIQKNLEALKKIEWDLIIADEYHYGTSTINFNKMLKELEYKHISYVSGTAMKDIETGRFENEQIYEWSYIDEQKQKDLEKEGKSESKQHLEMPTMSMYLIDIDPDIVNEVMKFYEDDEAFSMAKLIGTDSSGKLKYPGLIEKLLKQIMGSVGANPNLSPYNIQNNLNHTLWVLDKNVKGILGMVEVMKKMPEFDDYDLIPATGNVVTSIDEVKERINRNDRTITLTCYRFKEGTSVPEWNGVLMLDSGKSIEEYLQAIFRSQNPDQDNNKDECFVFDYNPQRALTLSYEICENTDKTGKKPVSDTIREYLKYAPILDYRGNDWNEIDVNKIMESFRAHGSFSEKFANVKNIDIEKIDDDIINSVLNVKAGKRGKTVEVNDNDVELGKNIMQQQREKDGKDKKVNKNEVKKVLQKIATVLSNIPEFLFDTPDKETLVEHILETKQKDLFEQITGLSIEDFKMWFEKGLLNPVLMNRNIEHFMESEEKLMNDPSGEKIEKFTKQHFNMRAEQGKTPLPLVTEMLDKLPKNIWKDKNKKFCDPCMGTGTFLLEIKERLMEGLKDKIKEEKIREEHILKNQIWGVDVDKSKTLIAEKLINNNKLENNLENADSLNINWNDMPKFDVVVGNPPYQSSTKEKNQANALWPRFLEKFIDISKDNGYVQIIIPTVWMRSSPYTDKKGRMTTSQVRGRILSKVNIKSITNTSKINKLFNVGVDICYLTIHNNNNNDDDILLITDDGEQYVKKDIPFFPLEINNKISEILNKTLFNDSLTKIKYEHNTDKGFTSDTRHFGIMSHEKTKEHKYPTVNTSAQYSKNIYIWSSKPHSLQFKPKIIFSDSGYARPFFDKGKFGLNAHSKAILLEDETEANNLMKYFSSKLVKFLGNLVPNSGFSVGITKIIDYLPIIPLDKEMTDKELYDYFNLTQKEINYIESQVK